MPITFSAIDLEIIYTALQVAQEEYRKHAATAAAARGHERVAAQFSAQEERCYAIMQRIDQEG